MLAPDPADVADASSAAVPGTTLVHAEPTGITCCLAKMLHHHHHHHHQITTLSHSINAIGPAPHRGGRKREHRSIVFATQLHRLLGGNDYAHPKLAQDTQKCS
jgi:hypothetical protein